MAVTVACPGFQCGHNRVRSDCVQVGYPMSGLDSKEYQLALARTRQAMHVHKAAGFMNTSNSARQAPLNHAQTSQGLPEAMQNMR